MGLFGHVYSWTLLVEKNKKGKKKQKIFSKIQLVYAQVKNKNLDKATQKTFRKSGYLSTNCNFHKNV